jgi:hypothetical protein
MSSGMECRFLKIKLKADGQSSDDKTGMNPTCQLAGAAHGLIVIKQYGGVPLDTPIFRNLPPL